jgi:hypothetical protein
MLFRVIGLGFDMGGATADDIGPRRLRLNPVKEGARPV